MAEPVEPRSRCIARPYCLRCYSPLRIEKRASAQCAGCGFINIKEHQHIYWTRERRLVELEQLAKLGVVVFLVLVTWLMLNITQVQFGLGQGYAVGFPIVAGVVLWKTAEKITHHGAGFRAWIVWTAIPLIVSLPFLAYAIFAAPEVPLWGRGISAVLALTLAGLALGMRWICARLGRWKDGRILRGQAQFH